MQTEDPLGKLLLDATEADRAVIASALNDRVGIDATSGRAVLLPGYAAMNARQKVLAVLLAAKAAHLLGLRDGEPIATLEIVATSGLPRGTVAPKLKELRETHLVGQSRDRAYYVPNAVLQRVAQELQ
jgi:hypothetical protein